MSFETAEVSIGGPRKPAIPQQVDELDSTVKHLGAVLSDLRARLAPVSRPMDPAQDKRLAAVASSEMGGRLANISDAVSELIDEMKDQINRLDI